MWRSSRSTLALRSLAGPGSPWRGPRRFNSRSTEVPPTREERIRALLTRELQPTQLRVIDHSGGCPGGTLEVFVESRAFEGQTLVAQHKWVKSLLRDEIRDVHAITLQTALPAPSS